MWTSATAVIAIESPGGGEVETSRVSRRAHLVDDRPGMLLRDGGSEGGEDLVEGEAALGVEGTA